MDDRPTTAKEALRQLRKANRLTLDEKIARAAEIIRATIGRFPSAVSFSGGRDSVALATIARSVDAELPLVFVDTGMGDARLCKFVRRFGGAQLVYLRNELDPEATWREKRCYPIGAKIAARQYRRANPDLAIDASKCCHIHKAAPLRQWVRDSQIEALIIGARGDDSDRHRFKLLHGEAFHSSTYGHTVAYPLLTWTAADTLEFIERHIPDYPFTYSRSEEMGCRCCAINLTRWPNNLAKLRQSDPAQHRHLIAEAGYGLQILMLAYDLTEAGARTLVERDGWDPLIAAGVFDRIPNPVRRGVE